MNGKVIVGGLAILSLGLLVFGLWFFGSRSPVDERFNLRRQMIDETTPQTRLLPDRVGDFLRQSLTPISRSADNQMAGSASYSDTDRKAIWLRVRYIADQQSRVAALDAFTGSGFKFHREAEFPYGYGTTQDGYTFVWINDGWLIQAFTSESDAETLLQFVNGYPY